MVIQIQKPLLIDSSNQDEIPLEQLFAEISIEDLNLYFDQHFAYLDEPSEKQYFESKIFSFIEASISLVGLIVLSPLLLIVSLLVALQGKGSIIYSQTRLGKNKKPFKIYKFRSMYEDAEKSGPFICTNYEDKRMTKLGSFLRKSKIDELPQLINVIKGDMSLVGPRPERPFFHQKNLWIENWHKRLDYKPGITGLAQISKCISHNPEHKIYADLYYSKNRSIASDIKLILFTVLPFLKTDKFFGMRLR